MDTTVSEETISFKRCSKCHDWAPLAHFGNSKRSKDGKRECCLDCRQLDYALNTAHILAVNAASRARRTPEQQMAVVAYNAQYFQDHREHCLTQAKKYRETHEEELRLYYAQYYLDNLDVCKARNKTWRKEHPKERQAEQGRRRAKLANAPVNDLTHDQWVEIQVAQDHRCYYCKKRRKGHLTQDHLTPLELGGSHTLHNVIAACGSCNSRKRIGKPPIPVQPFLLTVAPARKLKVRVLA